MTNEEQNSKVLIGLYWSARGENLAESVSRASRFIENVSQLLPSFERTYLWGDSDASSKWHNGDSQDLECFIRHRMMAYAGLRNTGNDIGYGPGDIGYRMAVSNVSTDYGDPQYLGVQILTGGICGSRVPESVLMTGSRKLHSELMDLNNVQKIFKHAIAAWLPEFGVVTTREFEDQVYSFEDMQSGARNIGAMNYFSDSSDVELLKHKVVLKQFENGILTQLVEEWNELEKQEAVEQALMLRTLLIPKHS